MRTGPTPKNAKHSRGSMTEWTDVVNTPYDGPRPSLPKTPGVAWFPQVEAWWETLTTMPHCKLWEESDWVAAIDLAYLKNLWWSEYFGGAPTMAMATEIRRREDNFGFTVEARHKLRIRYIDPPVEEEQRPETDSADGVTSIDKAPSRRARLAG